MYTPGSVVKNPPANAGDEGSIPGSGRSPGGGNGNPLQYSWLENPINRRAWWARVHRVTKELVTTECLNNNTTTNTPGSHHLSQVTISAAAAKSLQSCPTLCDPIDGSPPGSAIPRILQARTLEWVAISFSNAWKWEVKVKSLSRVRLLVTLWIAAHQAPPSKGFSRQEYWSGVPLPSPISGTPPNFLVSLCSQYPPLTNWH